MAYAKMTRGVRSRWGVGAVVGIGILGVTGVLWAQTGTTVREVPYVGHLELEGVAQNGSFDFAFALYSQPTGGTAVWNDVVEQVSVVAGSFSTSLAVEQEVWQTEPLYLSIEVRPHVDGDEPAFVPLLNRQRVAHVPLAARSDSTKELLVADRITLGTSGTSLRGVSDVSDQFAALAGTLRVEGDLEVVADNPSLMIFNELPMGSEWHLKLANDHSNSTGAIRQSDNARLEVTSSECCATSTFLEQNGSWMVSSDVRLKRDIAPIDGALAAVMEIAPVSFRYTAQPQVGEQVGFLAHEVEEHFPSLVSSSSDGLRLNYAGMSTVAVAGLRELKRQHDATVASMTARLQKAEERLRSQEELLNGLKTRLDHLEAQGHRGVPPSPETSHKR